MSLKDHIIQYCKERPNEWVHKGELGRRAVLEWGYENENMGRRCRELVEADILDRRENEKGQVEYKYKPLLDQIKPQTTPSRPLQASFFPVERKPDYTKI